MISTRSRAAAGEQPQTNARREEILAFIVLAIVIWPVVAVAVGMEGASV